MSSPEITLFRGFPNKSTFTSSPFVTKLELRLRFDDVRHDVDVGTPLKAPRGKIPYVKLVANDSAGKKAGPPTMMGDSSLIIRSLMQDGTLQNLNASLSATQKIQDLALRGLLEDRLYWLHYYEMWMQNYYTMRSWVLWSLPYPAQVVLGLVIWRTVQANLAGQGTGRFSADEVREFRSEIWNSLEAMLADSKKKMTSSTEPFWVLGGASPTEADMSMFGAVVAVIRNPA